MQRIAPKNVPFPLSDVLLLLAPAASRFTRTLIRLLASRDPFTLFSPERLLCWFLKDKNPLHHFADYHWLNSEHCTPPSPSSPINSRTTTPPPHPHHIHITRGCHISYVIILFLKSWQGVGTLKQFHKEREWRRKIEHVQADIRVRIQSHTFT